MMITGMRSLGNLPPGSRRPIYLFEASSSPSPTSPQINLILSRNKTDAPKRISKNSIQPPPPPPPPPRPPLPSEKVLLKFDNNNMFKSQIGGGAGEDRKSEGTTKMDKRRPPIYRPNSRGDFRTPKGSRLRGNESTVSSGGGGGDGGGGCGGSSDEDLSQQDLRKRLQDEAALYRRRLDTYRQAQQNQAALVSRLQAKVLQYKQRCADLEVQMVDHSTEQPSSLKTHSTYPITATSVPSSTSSSALEQAQQHLRELHDEHGITDLDTALEKLADERKKSEKLTQINQTLKNQLEESYNTNENLSIDLQKLTNDFETLREEMLIKEDEYKDEEQAFNNYYSSEHNRLLNLWRDVVSVKRNFMDIQTTTKKDLNKIKTDIMDMGREMVLACSRMDANVFADSMTGLKDKKPQEKAPSKLEEEIETIKFDKKQLENQLQNKEDRIQQLLRDIQTLEERCSEADQHLSQAMKTQEEVEILQGALRDIAEALIYDADTKESELLQNTHLHLTVPTGLPQKSPRRTERVLTAPAAFAESTISAVQAALNKYQSYIHELQVKLQSNKEQHLLVRKQLENADNAVAALEKQTKELIVQLDKCHNEISQLHQEKDTLQNTIESLRNEKSQLDRSRIDLNSTVDSLNQDYEKLLKISNKQHKDLESLYQEKLVLQNEIERLNQDGDLREMNLRGEEDRCSRIREELLTLKEELNKVYLANDMLEQQKTEAEQMASNLEKIKINQEMQLEKLYEERASGQDALAKQETIINNLEIDKKKLQDNLKKLENEKSVLQLQTNDQHNDIQSLRKELLHAEQQKLDLESEKVSLSERCKFLAIEKGKIDIELNQLARERGDLSNQLTVMGRKRDALNEEIMRNRQKLEQINETNSRINRNLEALVKECEEKQCTIDFMDKEIQRVQEQIAAIRSEKETLEAMLFDTQTTLETSDEKKAQMEKEIQELLVKQEQLKAQLQKTKKDLERSEKNCCDIKTNLTNQTGNLEIEFKQTVEQLKQQNDENVQKLTEEREQIRNALEKKMQQSLQQLSNEKDCEAQQLIDRIDGLQSHIDNVCQQHEELMLRAENDKQQALLIAHHDQKALQDKLESTRRELENEKENLDRIKREFNSRIDQDRININQLKDDLNKFKARLEEAKARNEEEKSLLQQKIEEICIERDNSQNEVDNLKVQLHLCENKGESVTASLYETTRKLKEAENNTDCLRKELTDVRRILADSNFEKEKYHNSNKELRDHVKRSESERREQGRQLEESLQKIANLEDVKLTLENDRSRLQNQLRELEKDQLQTEHKVQTIQSELHKAQQFGTQHQQEEKELQTRLLNEIEERERAQQEVHQLRKQAWQKSMSELERNLDQTRQELNKTRSQSAQVKEQWHAQEQELLLHLEDNRVKEKRLEDQKHNLEVCFVDATQQIQDLKAKLGGAEGRLRGLEVQLTQLEISKRDVEQKLFSIVSTLRRIAGIQLDGTVSMPYRLLSPSRRWSPARVHEEKDGIGEIDPEVVKKGVRNLMQQVAQIERERDDYKTQVITTKKQLQEVQDNQSKGDHKLNKIIQNFRTLQDEKGSLETKLGQKSIELQSQIEAAQKRSEEIKQMRDKIVSLELSLGGTTDQKLQCEDKIEKLKTSLNRVENEKRNLQEDLARIENRTTKLELQLMSAEGDLQRLQMMLQDKENAIQNLQEKCEHQSKSVATLEERCISLKSTIDQLNSSLEKVSNSEGEFKVEAQRLQRNLMETMSSQHTESERLKQIQKSLINSENEKRILSEKLETTQNSLIDMKRNNQILQDQLSRLNNELSNNEVQKSALESQLRLTQWTPETPIGSHADDELKIQLHTLQKERNELKSKIDSMHNKIRQLENENRGLERLTASGRSFERTDKTHESVERLEKYETDTYAMEGEKYELENRELRMKISRLETELAEKETELARLRAQRQSLDGKFDRAEIERYRAAQLQAERLLEAREQSHRQQISRLENQVKLLREQLNEEIKRRQQYVLRSTRAGREMQQLRQALGDSLRTVSQDPSLDALLLEHEARKLDSTLSTTASLPPALDIPSTSYRSITPQPK